MKKNLSMLLALCLFVGCSGIDDDQPDVPSLSGQVAKISCFDDLNGKRVTLWQSTFTYDSDNRLSGKTYKNYIDFDSGELDAYEQVTYSYSKNDQNQTVVRSLTEDKLASSYYASTEALIVDVSGRAVSAWSDYGNSSDKTYTEYSYDGKGCLVLSTVKGDDEEKFTTNWTADDITTVVWSYNNETTQLQYNEDVLNNASVDLLHIICFRDLGSECLAFNRGDLDEVCNLDFFGPRGQHMPSRVSTIDEKGIAVQYDIEYKLDSNQRIEEIKVKESYGQQVVDSNLIYTIEYK